MSSLQRVVAAVGPSRNREVMAGPVAVAVAPGLQPRVTVMPLRATMEAMERPRHQRRAAVAAVVVQALALQAQVVPAAMVGPLRPIPLPALLCHIRVVAVVGLVVVRPVRVGQTREAEQQTTRPQQMGI